MSKRTLFFLTFATLLIIGLIAYFGFYRTTPETTTPPTQNAFFPDRTSNPSTTEGVSDTNTDTIGTVQIKDSEKTDSRIPIFQKLSLGPITGFIPTGVGTTSKVRYANAQDGNIFETDYLSKTERRISNTTLVRAYETLFNTEGRYFINSYLSGSAVLTQGYTIAVATGTEAGSAGGTGFSKKNISATLAPTGTQLFYILDDSPAKGFLGDLKNQSAKEIWSNPVSEWVIQWINADTISLTTKASVDVPGFLYTLNPKNGAQKRILGNVNGLTALISPKTDKLIFTSTTKTSVSTNIYEIKTATVQDFPFVTFPEKCIWSQKNPIFIWCAVPQELDRQYTYPDDWYKGTVSFSDMIWKINSQTGETTEVLNPANANAGETIDATRLATDPSETYLYFVNKINGTLWGVYLGS